MTGSRFIGLAGFLMIMALLALNKAWAIQSVSIDYLTFRSSEPGKTYLEYQFIISNQQLVFVKRATGYKAHIAATLYLYHENGSLQAKHTIKKDIEASTFTATNDASVAHAFTYSFNVLPGSYTSILVLEDEYSESGNSIESPITCRNYYSGPAISSIELSQANQEREGEYFSHVFSHQNPKVWIYYESYNVPVSEPAKYYVPTTYRVIDSKGKVWHSVRESLAVTQNNPAFKLPFSVAHLPSDQYRFVIEQDIAGKTTRSETQFKVIQSPTDLRFKKYSQAVDELRYIATTFEIRQLKEMQNSSVRQRQKALNDFWKARDPNPSTLSNELKDEYYKRLFYANRNFSAEDMPGYKSDFGMIYILFGEPDMVQAKAGTLNKPAFQVWYYERLDLAFTFMGLNRFAPFNLQEKKYLVGEFLPK